MSQRIEFFWSKIPGELKQDPFFTFYIGIFLANVKHPDDIIMN
jgi:hypothetical protein